MDKANQPRILYMEDDQGLAKLFLKHMNRAGYQVDIAEDGIKGLRMYDPDLYQILAVDYAMPGKTGLEVIEELSSKGSIPPTIMVTGAGTEEIAVEALKLGVSDYVIKDPQGRYLRLLPAIIDKVLEKHRILSEKKAAETALQTTLNELEDLVLKRTQELNNANKTLEQEIEERRKAEKSLYEQNIFMQSILESLTHPFHVIDANDYKVVLANSASKKRGYVEGVFCHYAAYGLDSPCDEPIRPCPVNIIKANKRPVSFEVGRTALNGERRHEKVQAYPLFNEKGQVDKIIEYRVDITENKKAEQERKSYEERFEVIFKTTRECIFVKDLEGRYLHVNPAMESLFEKSAYEMMSLSDEDLFGEEEAQHIREIEARVAKGEIVEEEHTRKVNGKLVTFLDTRAPIRDPDGLIIGVCGIARNISDRKLTRIQPSPIDFQYPSETMRETLAQAQLAANSDSLVLLTGESGVGKDYMAKYIHDKSPRSKGPFFSINCAAVPPRLAESELFGYEKGSFTGALNRSMGLLELAEGGTLLLNEIGELSLAMQAKLLTFLDTKTFTRVGGRDVVSVNTRIIAATNRDLQAEVKSGDFRSDLYYRLNVITILIPPLRDRMEDLPVLTEQIIDLLARELQLGAPPVIDRSIMNKLSNYHWPGNIRELRNVLERGIILSNKGEIMLDTLDPDSSVALNALELGLPPGKTLSDIIADFKLDMIDQAMKKSGGNKKKAAEILGISRFALARALNSTNNHKT